MQPVALRSRNHLVWNMPVGCIQSIYTRTKKYKVLATDPGNPPAVWDWSGKTDRIGCRTVQKPDLLLLGSANRAPYPSTRGYGWVWPDLSGPISSSAFRVFLFMVAFRYPTVNCKILTVVLHFHFLMYWQPLYSKQGERRSMPHPAYERQSSVNNWSSCILGNLNGAWSHVSINKWLAACMSKYANDIAVIVSWTVTTHFIYKGATKCSRAF